MGVFLQYSNFLGYRMPIGFCWVKPKLGDHGLRTPNEAFFHWNLELLGLDWQIGQINSGPFGVFLDELSASILVQWVPCPRFPLFNHLFNKNKPLYPHPKYLFGIGIWSWIWAAKNYGISLRVSVVRGALDYQIRLK